MPTVWYLLVPIFLLANAVSVLQKYVKNESFILEGALLTGVVPLFCVYVASILCWCLTQTDLVYVPPEFSLSTLAATELNDMEWN